MYQIKNDNFLLLPFLQAQRTWFTLKQVFSFLPLKHRKLITDANTTHSRFPGIILKIIISYNYSIFSSNNNNNKKNYFPMSTHSLGFFKMEHIIHTAFLFGNYISYEVWRIIVCSWILCKYCMVSINIYLFFHCLLLKKVGTRL